MQDREANLLRSVTETTWRFYLWVGFLLAVVLFGSYAYVQQLRYGLIVTGLRDQVFWGLYITNFVFFIGISHAGTLISAILRMANAGWRTPITRLAEGITVFALCIGAPMVIVDLGRPDRIGNLFMHGRIQSPILWDVLSVLTYLAGCILYFYIPMIPDLATLAVKPELPRWRVSLYKTLSLGWSGAPGQWRLLERAITTMAIIIIPLAVSVHTVVSWIFVTTLRPGWNTSIFGPYFVTGAIYSGIAMVILCMYFLRKLYRFQDYIKPLHFRNLGILLLTLSLVFLYFNLNEYLTVGYKLPSHEKSLFDSLFWGEFAFYFKVMLVLTMVVPPPLLIAALLLQSYRQHIVSATVLASFMVVLGAWVERYVIIVPTLSHPLLPAQGLPPAWMRYQPTWVEWSITAAAFAGFLLIYTVLTKLFPMISVWETRKEVPTAEGTAPAAETSSNRRWEHRYSLWFLLALGILGATAVSQASAAADQPPSQKTTLRLEWEALPPLPEPSRSEEKSAPSSSLVYLYVERLFGLSFQAAQQYEAKAVPQRIAVTATLNDAEGKPLAFRVVDFSFQTLFGALPLGRRPTNQDGMTRLVIQDRRYGNGPIQVTYAGDGLYAATDAAILADFGPRPPRSLPSEGVLITPYWTAAIALPFLIFYGFMWAMFVYAFGYLILWRLPRAR